MPNSDFPETLTTTTAKDIMSTRIISIQEDETFRKAVELLTSHRLTGLPVLGSQGELLGIISEKDILASCESLDKLSPNFLDQKIQYTKSARFVFTSTPIDEVLAILSGKSFRHIPVVNKKQELKGIITRRDLIRILYLRIELFKNKIPPAELPNES